MSFWQPIEIGKLRFWSRRGCTEPVTEVCLAMHAKRRAECVAVLAFFKAILTWEGPMPSLRPPHLTGTPSRNARL